MSIKNCKTSVMMLVAFVWMQMPTFANQGLETKTQYIVMNFTDPSEESFQEVASAFSANAGKKVKIGIGVIISYFESSPEVVMKRLKKYLSLSEKYDMPLVIQIDGEQWWGHRPDLWNWWDSSKEGYDPDNTKNVEWTGWSSDHAIKIGWRNWGRQLRVLPMPNLMSPTYREACHVEMRKIVPVVAAWYRGLPLDKKYLFVGLKVGWESAIGVNNWYYPEGNELLAKPEAEDPQYGVNADSLPARGVQGMGYAAVSTLGIGHDGALKQEQLTEVVQLHLEDLSRECSQLGIPRDRLFTHCGGWSKGESLYTAAINEYSCPGWSFYDFAGNPAGDTTAMTALRNSDAPYWGVVEWLYNGANASDWETAIKQTLDIPLIRYMCIYNWDGIRKDEVCLANINSFLSKL